MQYNHAQLELAMCGLRVLPIIAMVAFVAYMAKSRRVFVLGTLGSLLGFVVPEFTVHVQYSSAEAAYVGSMTSTANHVLSFGVIGAAIAATLGVCSRRTIDEQEDRHHPDPGDAGVDRPKE